MKKTLLFISPNLGGGGAEKILLTLLQSLNRDKFDISLLLVSFKGEYVNEIPKDIKLIELNINRVRHAIFKIVNVINKEKPDLIFSTISYMNIALLFLKPFFNNNSKIVIRSANTISKAVASYPLIKRVAYMFLYKFYYPKADLIISQSNKMHYDLNKFLKIDDKKIKRIYNPINLTKVQELSEGSNPFSDTQTVNILAAGKLRYQKGFDLLLSAFKKIINNGYDVKLTILGEGPLRESLLNEVKKMNLENEVTFLGFVSNPYIYYKHADVFVLSSRWEGFPNVLLEAIACNCKVVATDCESGPSEIIGKNEFGILVEEGNIDAIESGILEMIRHNNKYNSVKRRALDFDIDKIVLEYEEILLKV